MGINLGNPAYRFDEADTATRMAQHGWSAGPSEQGKWAMYAAFHAGRSVNALVGFDEDGFVRTVVVSVEMGTNQPFTPQQLGRDLPSPGSAMMLVAAREDEGQG